MKSFVIALFIYVSFNSLAQLPQLSSGTINRFENFKSEYVQARNVDVWLPKHYDSSKSYAVLYMHDGQMLFDANQTWNKQEWKVDEVVSELMEKELIQDCIVVGVWNVEKYRYTDYFPEKAYNLLPDTIQIRLKKSLMDKPLGDEYLLFLTKELKPFVDKEFSTKPDRDHTFIAGSSMGGLISMYAICEYPEIFGSAACISTHWPGAFGRKHNLIPDAFESYMKDNLPSPSNHSIYFDYGTETLDKLYKPYQQNVDVIMKEKGFTSENWMTKEFIGENHSENSWSKRLHIPITFILKK